MTTKQKTFFSGIEIPEQRKGDVQITHKKIPKGSRVEIISMRNALFDGRHASFTFADKDYYMHELSYANGVWMTDSLQEIEQMKRELADMKGRVLIGGLGLGVMLQYLPWRIKSATVIERDARIIEMIAPHTMDPRRDEIINADIFDFVRTVERNQFDYAFLDVWQLTGEHTLLTHVIPLRLMLDELIPQKNIRCWGEREMWGQVRHGLTGFVELYFSLDDWRMKHDAENKAQIRSYVEIDKVKAPFWQWFAREKMTRRKALNGINDFIAHPLKWFRQEKLAKVVLAQSQAVKGRE